MVRRSRLLAVITVVGLAAASCDATAPPAPTSPLSGSVAAPSLSAAPLTPSPAASMASADGRPTPDPNAATMYPRDPRAPARLAGTTHDIDLVIEERNGSVAEGVVREVWTYGGTVPGPVLRVTVGDTLRIHLVNDPPPSLPQVELMHPPVNDHPHSVGFHGSMVAPNEEMTSLKPGEETFVELTVPRAGVWMYHCETEPVLQHAASGMYGMLIVEPAGGLEPVDQELFLVQGEWYLGGRDQPASLAKAAAVPPEPDFVVFNGLADQYLVHPIEVETGKRIRVFLLDAGPNLDSSFHVEGVAFDRVIKEGVELVSGNAGDWGSQAVDLSPGQGAIVEFTLPEDGLYPFGTHALNLAGLGARGILRAGDGDPLN